MWPASHVRCSGVAPLSLATPTSAPEATSSCATSSLPAKQAACRAADPYCIRWSTAAPLLISISQVRTLFNLAAIASGVYPARSRPTSAPAATARQARPRPPSLAMQHAHISSMSAPCASLISSVALLNSLHVSKERNVRHARGAHGTLQANRASKGQMRASSHATDNVVCRNPPAASPMIASNDEGLRLALVVSYLPTPHPDNPTESLLLGATSLQLVCIKHVTHLRHLQHAGPSPGSCLVGCTCIRPEAGGSACQLDGRLGKPVTHASELRKARVAHVLACQTPGPPSVPVQAPRHHACPHVASRPHLPRGSCLAGCAAFTLN